MRRCGENRFEARVLNQDILLEKADSTWSVKAHGHDVLLDPCEAEAIFRVAQSHPATLVYAGLHPEMVGDSPTPEIDQRADLMAQLPAGESVVLDKTTVFNAIMATDEDALLDPIMLMDLSVVTFAFVTYENVVVQPHSSHVWRDDDDRFGGVVTTLDASRDSIAGALWSICAPLKNAGQELDVYSKTWRDFWGSDGIRLDSHVLDDTQDSPLYWDGIPASYYLHTHLPRHKTDDPESLNKFLTVQTVRTLFNDQIAGMLKLPYLSSSLRSPIYSELLRHKLEAQQLADRLLGALGPEPVNSNNNSPYVVEASAPFLLGIILSRISSTPDFWPALHELRRELAPLRQRLHEERAEWHGRSGQYLRNYLRHLNNYLPADAKLAENALEAVATSVASVATGSPILGGNAAKLLVKLVKLLQPTNKAYNWYLKTFKPDVAIVVELSKEAAKLRSVETEIERIWKQNWSRAARDDLEWLASARPEAFAKLRNLG